jgi:hypothetical protein
MALGLPAATQKPWLNILSGRAGSRPVILFVSMPVLVLVAADLQKNAPPSPAKTPPPTLKQKDNPQNGLSIVQEPQNLLIWPIRQLPASP